METQNIQHLIRKFFENRFSKNTQLRFRYWFRLENSQSEKDEVMQELWENSHSRITPETWDDLEQLQTLISEGKSANHLRIVYRQVAKYAAVVLLLILTSVTTYYFSSKNTSQSQVVVTPKFVEFFVPYGERQKVKLADGSTVWVNAGSVLIYPEKFTAETRTVYLSGEANFKVAKNPNQPFIVKTKYIGVRALGTVFNVESYPNSIFTKATLEQGSVLVNVNQKQASSNILKPNEQLVYNDKYQMVSVTKVDAVKLNSWKNGYLIFQDASFEEIIATLERKYNVQINYNANKYNGRSYYIKFNPNESIYQALNVLSQLIHGLTFKINNATVFIN